MEYREYKNFDEKKAVLETIFGQWPPPFDPVWAVQVSQGRSGSNALWRMVKSFFKEATKAPVFEALDHEEWIQENNPERNWIPEPGKKYLYYNVHSKNPHQLHFPLLFYFLQNSPKIVHLTREDHLTRAISNFYVNLVGELRRQGNNAEAKKAYEMPVDMDRLERYIWSSKIETEIMKSLISEFVSPERLLEISHAEMYYTDTFETLRKLMRFLECDPQQNQVTLYLQKDTPPDHIPNRHEISERYQRDLTEHAYWVPNDLDLGPIHNEVQETVAALIQIPRKELI